MSPRIQKIIRATIALQFAALEYEDKDINDAEAHKGMENALKEIQRQLKMLVREEA